MKFSSVDLFAGCGGLSEGLSQSGIESIYAQELHPQAALTYSFNHPNTDVAFGDIRKINREKLIDDIKEKLDQELFLLCGGPPCQGFSSAGLKNKDDPRNSLVKDFINIAEKLRPKAILIENVPGFARRYQGIFLRYTLLKLAEAGYSTAHKIIDASNYGVPQRRMRFMLIGIRKDLEILPSFPEHITELEPDSRDIFMPKLCKVSISEAISDLEAIRPNTELVDYPVGPRSKYQEERRKHSQQIFNHLAGLHRQKAVEMFSHIPEGGNIRDVPLHLRTKKRTLVRSQRNKISNAIVTLPDDLIHYEKNRILTVRETARIQSFDDTFVFLGKRTSCNQSRKTELPQYTQIGNAIPPLLGKEIGSHLIKLFGGSTVDLRDLQKRCDFAETLHGNSGGGGYLISTELPLKLKNENLDYIHPPITETKGTERSSGKTSHIDIRKQKLSRQWVPKAN